MSQMHSKMHVYQIKCSNVGDYDIVYEGTQMCAYVLEIGLAIWMNINPH